MASSGAIRIEDARVESQMVRRRYPSLPSQSGRLVHKRMGSKDATSATKVMLV